MTYQDRTHTLARERARLARELQPSSRRQVEARFSAIGEAAMQRRRRAPHTCQVCGRDVGADYIAITLWPPDEAVRSDAYTLKGSRWAYGRARACAACVARLRLHVRRPARA
jgi:hypothetical protein